ncbi:DUF6089 family protein [Mucilaginibacter ximonensis]|uniref:DUF6089 family protein n=1 Tax=Mucilaginibacter ximonensis TaxID=538021 RepID=A0ABW5YGH4_9SPHI
MVRSLLVAFFLVVISLNLKAQAWEIGAFGGGSGYMGDLNQKNPFKVSGVGLGAFARYNFNGYISVGAGVSYGVISAADSLSSNQQTRLRNLSFTTRLLEGSLTAEFNFMEFVPSVSKNIYTPYVLFGVAYTDFNPQTTYNGHTYNLRDYQTGGVAYKNTALAVPFGIGFKYNVAGRMTLAANLGYRIAHTDYLDDVSGIYPDRSKMSATAAALSDPSINHIGRPGTQRGDLRLHDTYFFTGLSISYTFITQKCYYER